MCFEYCGPNIYDDPEEQAEEDAAYQQWLDANYPESAEEEED